MVRTMLWARMMIAVWGSVLSFVPAFASERIALVIGNGAYQRVPTLPNPSRDAADMARALERLDFRVTRLTNATASEMRKALIEFGRASEGSLISVVYYAGHGMEAGGENWLIPVDAELRTDTDVESESVSLRSVNLQVGKARKLGLIILDACRNNPFAAGMKRSLNTRAVSRGLAPTEPTDNVLIAYAARDGTTASDGDGRNSPFTTALLRHIETPGLEISFLFRRVRDDVMTTTNRTQQPFVYGSLSKEEIYLKTPVAAVASPSAKAATPSPPAAAAVPSNMPTTPVPAPDNNPKQASGNPFTPEDNRRVTAVGAEQQLKLPPFVFGSGDASGPNSNFVGVWSNKRGWGGGRGRYGMLIITEVSGDGLARGYYLWGPPTKQSWSQSPAGYTPIAEKIVEGAFTFKTGDTVKVQLLKNNIMKLTSYRDGKLSDTAGIELQPIWQSARPAPAAADARARK
jgi:hypothetical protein